MDNKFFVVGFVIWVIVLLARTWPTGPCFLNANCMNYLLQEYGVGYVLGNILGEIVIIAVISYVASWIWTKAHPKKESES